MILACLSCQARYLVPASHFASGARMVRCARCNHIWLAEMPAEPASTLAAQLAALAPAEQAKPAASGSVNLPALRNAAFRRHDWLAAGSILLLSFLLLWAALDRKEIARKHPWAERFYDRVGLHIYHAGEGLSLTQVRSELRFEDGILQLAVEGQIHNDTDKPQSVPDLLAAAIGPDDHVMQSWQIDAPAATVAPGASVPFSTEIHAPKGTVVEINLHFVEPEHEP
jgi:predicted Zn finger-like uncharacterized protein